MQRLLTTLAIAAAALGSLGAGCNGSTSSSGVQLAKSSAVEPATTNFTGTEPREAKSVDVPMDDIKVPAATVPPVGAKLELSDEEWRDRLTTSQYRVLRRAGTEAPGSGAYNKHYEPGNYHCSACNNPLFSSETKFDSKTGWPSFYQPIAEGRVGERVDKSHGMTRVEVVCEHCEGHLGHVFNDGPDPTGLRYCINSVSLYFRPEASLPDDGE